VATPIAPRRIPWNLVVVYFIACLRLIYPRGVEPMEVGPDEGERTLGRSHMGVRPPERPRSSRDPKPLFYDGVAVRYAHVTLPVASLRVVDCPPTKRCRPRRSSRPTRPDDGQHEGSVPGLPHNCRHSDPRIVRHAGVSSSESLSMGRRDPRRPALVAVSEKLMKCAQNAADAGAKHATLRHSEGEYLPGRHRQFGRSGSRRMLARWRRSMADRERPSTNALRR